MAERMQDLFTHLKEQNIHSPTSKFEQKWLWHQAVIASLRNRQARIVELGTLEGYSALVMADGLRLTRERHEDWEHESHIWTVDNYSQATSHEKVKEGISSLNYSDLVTAIAMDDIEFLQHQQDSSVSMLFVDSLHSYKHVREVLEVTMPKMELNSLVCGHDYCWREFGVVYAVEEWREKYKATLCGFGVYETIWWSIVRSSLEEGIIYE